MSLGGFVALLVVVVAVSSWSRLRRLAVRHAAVGHIIATGHAALAVGYLLGLIVGADEARTMRTQLTPIVSFVTGWVGFAVGVRFDLRILRRVPLPAYWVALAPALMVFLLIGGAGFGLALAAGLEIRQAAALGLVLGGAAGTTGPSLAAMVRRGRAARDPLLQARARMIEFAAGFDDVVVVLAAIVAFAAFRPSDATLPVFWIVALNLGVGVLLGLVTWMFLGGRSAPDERLLLGIAAIAFAAGFGGWLEFSPSAVCALSGFVLVNLPGKRAWRLLSVVHAIERPATILLLTLVGFHIAGAATWLLAGLLVLMTAVRWALKYASARIPDPAIPPAAGLDPGGEWTLGLISQGSLGLVIALSAHYVWHNEGSLALLGAVGLASVINELVAPGFMLRALRTQVPPRPREPVTGPAGGGAP